MGTLLRNVGVAVGIFVLTWLLIQSALGVEMALIEKAQSEKPDTVIDELGASVRRTTFVYLPLVALGAGLAVGFLGRNWRWAWLIALFAAGPVVSSFVVSLVASPSYLTGTVAVLVIGSIVITATVVMWWREGRTVHGA